MVDAPSHHVGKNGGMDSDAAFDLDGTTWRPVSPKLSPVRVTTAAIALGLPLLAGLVLAVIFGSWVWIAPVVLALLLVWVVWLVPRRVRAFRGRELVED